jgi:hypothetical protein
LSGIKEKQDAKCAVEVGGKQEQELLRQHRLKSDWDELGRDLLKDAAVFRESNSDDTESYPLRDIFEL